MRFSLSKKKESLFIKILLNKKVSRETHNRSKCVRLCLSVAKDILKQVRSDMPDRREGFIKQVRAVVPEHSEGHIKASA